MISRRLFALGVGVGLLIGVFVTAPSTNAAVVPVAPEDGGPRNWEVTGVSSALFGQ